MLVKMRKSNIYKKLTIILVNTNTNNDDILDLDNRKISKLEMREVSRRKKGRHKLICERRQKKRHSKGYKKKVYMYIYS